MYQTLKYHHVCSDEAVDKTHLFLVNLPALTRDESKFCMSRLWNKMYGMSMWVKALSAAPVSVMMWWGIPRHSLQSPLSLSHHRWLSQVW